MADLNENYNNLCRICAKKTSILVGFNIFEGEGNARQLNKKIESCLPIQIHAEDQLPKMICNECVYNLDLFFNFREKSIQTETLLRRLIRRLNEMKCKIEEPKISQPTMNIVTTISNEQLALQNQEILQQTDIGLVHELAKRDCGNIHVEEAIILNSQNININHTLENIDLSTHELPSDDITNVIHEQDLNLHHGTTIAELGDDINIQHSQLSVQNLELIHAQHNLMDQFEQEQIKNNDNKLPVITLKNEADLLIIKDKEEVKNESNKQDTSASSESDDSSDLDFDPLRSDEIIKNDDSQTQYFFDNQLYDQRNQLFNTNEICTSVNSNGSQWFYCNVCGKTLPGKEEFYRHYEEHLLKCMICETMYSNLDMLNAHRIEMHSKNVEGHQEKLNDTVDPKPRTRLKPALKSDNSNEVIKKEDSDNEVENGTQDEDDPDEEEPDKNTKRKRCEPKVCKECGKHYKTNYKLQEHMRKHTGEQPYKCKECDKAFRSKIGLAQHEAKHTGNYEFSCPTCGKGFQCRSYLIVHQRVHSDLKPYPCTTCGTNFKTKQSLLDHMNRHLGVKPYLCDTCGRGFITKGLWKSHQKVHSGMDNRQYPCTVCNKMFVSKSYLATHLRIHTGEKPFMCEVCGKGFLTRVDLRIHSTMHTGEKSFVCEICGKAFARRDALRCHRRSHTGERPYRCDVCGQTFTQFSPMAIHKRLHTGERPYSCEVCAKTFVSRSTMMSHRKKHSP